MDAGAPSSPVFIPYPQTGHAWFTERVDAPKLFNAMGERSLALDSAGQPHVAYGADLLYYARFDGSHWHTEVVDDTPGTGRHASLALDGSDNPHIAYCMGATYPTGNPFYCTTLKYAYWDTGAWHIETVDSDPGVGSYASLALDAAGQPHIGYYDDNNGVLKYAYSTETATWQIETVDGSAGVGEYLSMVLDASGQPAFSYYDATNGALKFAWNGSPKGTASCFGGAETATWHIETVDDNGNVGLYTSLTLDSHGRPHISYHDVDNPRLKYAFHDTAWQIQTVDAGTYGGRRPGWYSSLELDANDEPHIAYCSAELGGVQYDCHDLMYAQRSGSSWITATLELGGNYASLDLDAGGEPHITHCPFSSASSELRYVYRDGVEWHFETVDHEKKVGQYTSLAVDDQGWPHVAYCTYDYGRPIGNYCTSLLYARFDGTSWMTETVDANGWVGSYASLALDSSGRPHIAYHDQMNGGLKYAFFGGTAWVIETVDSTTWAGTYASLGLDASDRPHISYYCYDELKYAHFDGTSWQIVTVDSSPQVGWYTSLAVDASDRPHISYYDLHNSALKYAFYSGTGWISETVDASGSVGEHTSLALDGDGHPHISYYDFGREGLKYAYHDGTAWFSETVDSAGSVGQYNSLALDNLPGRAGAVRPHIAYLDQTVWGLKYAFYDGSAWQVETVEDSPGAVGFYTSLALDADNQPHISYLDSSFADLKYAYGRPLPYTYFLPAVYRTSP
jgi:hypothetical protein